MRFNVVAGCSGFDGVGRLALLARTGFTSPLDFPGIEFMMSSKL